MIILKILAAIGILLICLSFPWIGAILGLLFLLAILGA